MYDHASFTSKGSRNINEDSFGVTTVDNNSCYIVCDGLGGHGMGEVASVLVKDVFMTSFQTSSTNSNFISNTFNLAQEIIEEEQYKQHIHSKMKTTATVLTLIGNKAFAGHIGDSRLYAFKNDKIVYQTKDHSVPQLLAFTGQISQDEIRHHPDRNKLLKSIGSEWDKPMYEIEQISHDTEFDGFLLCTDGFWEYIDEQTMCSLFKKAKNAKDWLKYMIKVIEVNGTGCNMDNYTAIAIMKNKE